MRRNVSDPFPSSPGRSTVRRRISLALAFAALALATVSTLTPSQAGAQDLETGAEPPVFDVIQISGLVDGIVADFIEESLRNARDASSGGLVLQVNSPGAVISDERLVELAEQIRRSPVPVYAWVGPSGAVAKGRVAQLLASADELAVAVGASYGDTGDLVIPEELLLPEFVAVAPDLRDDTVDEQGVIRLGLAERDSPTLGFFVLDLPGFETQIDTSGDQPVRVPLSPVRFSKPSLFDGWMHTFASPAMAYLLFLIGGALLVFEFFTAGVGIAGVVGALCFIGGCYGLDVLPTRPWALALLVVALLGYAIDVQTGVARFWSVVASVCLVIGSLFLFEGLSISWITLGAGVIGVALSMISGMPAMIRTRFGTPTIGREWMIGEMGVAAEELRREGVVIVNSAPWKARVNRTTPIAKGDPVRVVAIEGLFLEVEPEEGGARDYRERRASNDD
jgi:membrane-bound serine protease (ClpP class)